MNLDPLTCYNALTARDRRFDGWFYVGVSSTGIYCRPVCAVKTPKAVNCHFFANSAAAECAGYRPCLKCRPELAPGNGQMDMSGRLARAAAQLIDNGFLHTGSADAQCGPPASLASLAVRIGVTDRHLRRIFELEFGVTLSDYVRTQRLLLAKRLLTDTQLPMGQVAMAAGFGSVRRFNDAFVTHYKMNPLRLRKSAATPLTPVLTFRLGYRPPFAWDALLAFFRQRQIDGVESVDEVSYSRSIRGPSVNGSDDVTAGWIRVHHLPQQFAVCVTLPVTLAMRVAPILGKVRQLFDLDCRPELIATQLGALAEESPGLRLPGAVDGFEVAVRAIVGQQITVKHARVVLSRLASRFGVSLPETVVTGSLPDGIRYLFPTAEKMAGLTEDELCREGLIRSRAQAIVAVARQVHEGVLRLDAPVQLDALLQQLCAIRGIGDWTAQYIAMRALSWPNAWLDNDIVLKKQLGARNAKDMREQARQWEPWRSYAALHLWRRSAAASMTSIKENP